MTRYETTLTSQRSDVEPEISIRIGAVRRVLVTLVLGLAATSAVGLALDTLVDAQAVGKVVGWFDVNTEANIPTWFSMMLLATAATLAAAIALGRHPVGLTRPYHWFGLGALMLAFSLDEVVQLHEEANRLDRIFDLGGIFVFAWVIPGSLFVLVAGVVFLPFLRDLPPAVRRGILGAGALFVFAALGLEFVEAAVVEQRAGEHGMAFKVIGHLQETMEMLGVVWLIVVLLRVLVDRPSTRVIVSE